MEAFIVKISESKAELQELLEKGGKEPIVASATIFSSVFNDLNPRANQKFTSVVNEMFTSDKNVYVQIMPQKNKSTDFPNTDLLKRFYPQGSQEIDECERLMRQAPQPMLYIGRALRGAFSSPVVSYDKNLNELGMAVIKNGEIKYSLLRYPSGKVMQEIKRDGNKSVMINYYPGGKKFNERVTEGDKVTDTLYYPNGQCCYTGSTIGKKLIGTHTVYDANGNVLDQATYETPTSVEEIKRQQQSAQKTQPLSQNLSSSDLAASLAKCSKGEVPLDQGLYPSLSMDQRGMA